MFTYMVEYTTNGMKTETMLVSAEDYTKAYLSVCYQLPLTSMITSISRV